MVEVSAQSGMDTLRFADRIWSMKKKAVVLEYMQLTEAEKSAFWPVYDSYNNATQYLELETIYLFASYSKNLGNYSGDKLADLSTRILRNDVTLARIRKQYFKKFKNALSAKQASAFMQLDNEFRTMIRIDTQKNSPSMEILQLALQPKASLR